MLTIPDVLIIRILGSGKTTEAASNCDTASVALQDGLEPTTP